MLTLLVVGLATFQAVEVFRHSTLQPVADLRAWMEMQPGILPELRACGWCLSIWVAFALIIAMQIPVLNWAVWGLAASRLANLLNDWSYEWSRTPKDGTDDEDEDRNI